MLCVREATSTTTTMTTTTKTTTILFNDTYAHACRASIGRARQQTTTHTLRDEEAPRDASISVDTLFNVYRSGARRARPAGGSSR